MKSKKASGGFHEDYDSFKGNRKRKLTPIKKQKSKNTQFFNEIEEFEKDEFDMDESDFDEDELKEFEDLEVIEDLDDIEDDDEDEGY